MSLGTLISLDKLSYLLEDLIVTPYRYHELTFNKMLKTLYKLKRILNLLKRLNELNLLCSNDALQH